LSDRLTRAITHMHGYRDVALRVQQHIRAQYGWPAIAERTEALYYAVAARRRQSTADGTAQASNGLRLPKHLVGGSR